MVILPLLSRMIEAAVVLNPTVFMPILPSFALIVLLIEVLP